jgi:hypothetical protein
MVGLIVKFLDYGTNHAGEGMVAGGVSRRSVSAYEGDKHGCREIAASRVEDDGRL